MNNNRHDVRMSSIVDAQTLQTAKDGAVMDTIGSVPGSRQGPMHGGPSITWVSLDSKNKTMTTGLSSTPTIYIQGYRMSDTDSIYLIPDTRQMYSNLKHVDIFSEFTNRVGTENPPFTGIPIEQWVYVNENNIKFDLLAPSTSGKIDIALVGRAGYYLSSSSTYTQQASGQGVITVTV